MRELSVTNRHPRLRLDRRSYARAINLLDQHFRFTAADLPTLSPAGQQRAAAQLGQPKPAHTRPGATQRTARTATDHIGSHTALDTSTPRFAATCSAAPAGELSITFLTDAALARLHADFLGDPSTTDVITFEGEEAFGHAGDICVSVDTALAYADAHDLPFAEELLRYVIHGWLHLAGYDDLAPAKKRRMRAAEERALKLLRAHAALPACTLKPASSPATGRAVGGRYAGGRVATLAANVAAAEDHAPAEPDADVAVVGNTDHGDVDSDHDTAEPDADHAHNELDAADPNNSDAVIATDDNRAASAASPSAQAPA